MITDLDLKIGENIKRRRKALGLSQSELANGLGISFQQVQKYETGKNRVSASRLYEVSGLLEVPLLELYGLETTSQD